MSQPIQTKSTRRSNPNKNTTAFSFLAAKKSNIPLAIEREDDTKNIVNWGKNNEYPYFLNYLSKANPIHSGILRSKRYYTVSGGLQYDGQDLDLWRMFYDNKKDTPNEKNLDDLQEDISLNFEKSNLFCYKILFTKVGEKKYRKLKEIPFEKIRFEIDETEEGSVFLTGNIKVSDNWLDNEIPVTIIEPYKALDDTQRVCFVLYQEESGQALDSAAGRDVNTGIYPDPPYGGGITAIDTGIQVDVHGNSEIHNGFSLGTILNLNNGVPKNEDAKRDLERDLGASTTGSYQAGRMMVLYNNGKDNESTVTNLNGNDLPDRYTNTKIGSIDSTIHAHSVTVPILFGIKTEGSLGNATELETGYAIMQANYFNGRRRALLSVLNWIGKKIVGLQGTITFGEVALNLPKEEVAQQPQFNINMGKEKERDIILERLKMCGRPKQDFEILYSKPLIGQAMNKEDLINEFKNSFATLPDNTQRTLNLIEQGEGFNSIRKALDVTGTQLASIYKQLQDRGMITANGILTPVGLKQIAVNEVESMQIMYDYALRPELQGEPAILPDNRTRDFCATLITLNRLYTREDINLISGMEGYDVFAYRGGWYHDPNLDVNQPGCRHQWSQVVTFK